MPTWLSAEFLLVPLAAALGYLGATLQNWSFHRRLYSVEAGVADLEGKLLTEIKKRAGHERQNQRHIDQEILDAAKNAEPAKPALPWWSTVKGPRAFNG